MRNILLLLSVILSGYCAFAQKTMPVIELSGTPYERGLQHGRQLKSEIAEVYTKWKQNMERSLRGNADSIIIAFLAATNFEPATRKHTPYIMDEMKGIAEGSGQSFNDVLVFQLIDEFWVYTDKLYNQKNHHCSAIGVPAIGGRPAYIAQNADIEAYTNGYQVLLHIAADKTQPEQYIVSCAGLVALNGMNAKGIGICVNTIMELQASTDGLPVAFIIRELLRKQNGNEALSFLQTVKHASGQNYLIGIADSVYDFEASSGSVVRFQTNNSKGVIYHTNHALANHDVKDWYKKYHERVMAGEAKNMNSAIRFASLEQRLSQQEKGIDPDIIKTTLRSKDDPANPVCRSLSGGGFTFSSVLFTLTGERSVQVTYGPPDQAEFKEYFFK